jgi:uncharacterized membrane protein
MFTSYFIIDQNRTIGDALKESGRITNGHKLQLFGFCFVIGLMNLFGFLVFIVGLLVTIPITWISIAFVYRKLSDTPSTPTNEVI